MRTKQSLCDVGHFCVAGVEVMCERGTFSNRTAQGNTAALVSRLVTPVKLAHSLQKQAQHHACNAIWALLPTEPPSLCVLRAGPGKLQKTLAVQHVAIAILVASPRQKARKSALRVLPERMPCSTAARLACTAARLACNAPNTCCARTALLLLSRTFGSTKSTTLRTALLLRAAQLVYVWECALCSTRSAQLADNSHVTMPCAAAAMRQVATLPLLGFVWSAMLQMQSWCVAWCSLRLCTSSWSSFCQEEMLVPRPKFCFSL